MHNQPMKIYHKVPESNIEELDVWMNENIQLDSTEQNRFLEGT